MSVVRTVDVRDVSSHSPLIGGLHAFGEGAAVGDGCRDLMLTVGVVARCSAWC